MTISSPEPITAAHAVRLVAYALSDSGLLLEDRPDSIVIRAGESAALPSCDRESHAVQNDRPATTPDVTPPPHEPPLEGIRRVSDTRFVLTRAAMNELLDFRGAGGRGARLVPHEVNGQVEGIRIYGIRRANPLGRLGLQNGDLLRQINGHVLASVANALEAYAEIRSSDRVTVSLTRRGSEMDIEYVIVDAPARLRVPSRSMDRAEAKRRIAGISKALTSETDLGAIWERFQGLADRQDFLQIGKPGKNPRLESALSAIAARHFEGPTTLQVRATRIRKPRFWHGAGRVSESGAFCSFFYIEALDAGLVAFIRGLSGRVDYYRFSLVDVPKDAVPAKGGDA